MSENKELVRSAELSPGSTPVGVSEFEMVSPVLADFIIESNRIEGIHRTPTRAEQEAHGDLCFRVAITIPALEQFVSFVQPGAALRNREGLNVYVGNHVPPRGGPHIAEALDDILEDAHRRATDPYDIHCRYETLHPFTDGNGRSGRALWLWMMLRRDEREARRALGLGFLHSWYYQSLAALSARTPETPPGA